MSVGIRLVLFAWMAAAEAAAQFANPPRLSWVAYVGTPISGSGLAVDAQGNAYVAGTSPCDIAKVDPSGGLSCLSVPAAEPVRAIAMDAAGSIYATGAADSNAATVVKLSADASQTFYTTEIPGAYPAAITVDRSGRAYVTGFAYLPFGTIPGIIVGNTSPNDVVGGCFAVRLDAEGAIDYASYLGDSILGGSIAVDSHGDAWIAGTSGVGGPEITPPTLSFVAKLDASGHVLFSSSFGGLLPVDGVRGVAVDANDAAYVVGVASGGIPTTPGALQPNPPRPLSGSGYVLKYSSSGDVAYGTYLGTRVGGIAVDAAGNYFLGVDVNGVNDVTTPTGTPAYCAQGVNLPGLLTVLSADGSTVLSSVYLSDDGVYSVALDGRGGVYTASSGGAVAGFDLTAPASELGLSCVVNGALGVTYVGHLPPQGYGLSVVAPGEVVTLAGTGFSSSTSVTFGGYPAPVLYTDSGQINAVVPFEIGGPVIQLTLNDGQDIVNWPVLVMPAVPEIFANAIINEDGAVNSADHPVPAGSTISVYLSGLGLMTPPMADGSLGPLQPPYPSPALAVSAAIAGLDAPLLAASQAPGMIAGLVVVSLRIPTTTRSGAQYLTVYDGPASAAALVVIAGAGR